MGTTGEAFKLGDVLRSVAAALEVPVKVILIVLILSAAALLGWIIAEFFTERRRLKVKLPALLDEVRSGKIPLSDAISSGGLLRRQKEALLELTRHPDFNEAMLEALAVHVGLLR